MSFDVTISIVLYENDPSEIKVLLESISKITLHYQVIIIDNSPTSILRQISEQFDNIIYIFNNKNVGYGKGHNKAIQLIRKKSRYHIIVNPDITFNAGVVETLYYYMEQHPDIGQLMPKVLYEDGTIQKLCKLIPKPSDLIIRRFFAVFKRKIELKYELPGFDYEKLHDVPILSGCFMFIRNEILTQVGGFDPRFFLYLEDFDLTRRIHEISRTVYYPNVAVVHRFKKESYTNLKMLTLHIISAIKYFNKWGWLFDKKRHHYNTILSGSMQQK